MAFYRLDKIVASSTNLSRKEVKLLVNRGEIWVDGMPAHSADGKYDPEAVHISIKGEPLTFQKKYYFMMNKPAGVVSSTEDRKDRTVLELLSEKDSHLKLFPAGRLDKDAEGLLLLTDDGDFCHSVISPGKKVEKRYYVEVDREITSEDAAKFQKGIELKDFKCMPATLEILDNKDGKSAYVTICEGKYHQVKRMFASCGKNVQYLKRIAIGKLALDEFLDGGAYRPLTEQEIKSIFM